MATIAELSDRIRAGLGRLGQLASRVSVGVAGASGRVLSSAAGSLRQVARNLGAIRSTIRERAAPRRVRHREGMSIEERERVVYRGEWTNQRSGRKIYRTVVYSVREGLNARQRRSLGRQLLEQLMRNERYAAIGAGLVLTDIDVEVV